MRRSLPVRLRLGLLLLAAPLLAADPQAARKDREQALLSKYAELPSKGVGKPGEAERRLELLKALQDEALLPEPFVRRLKELLQSACQRAEKQAKPDQLQALLGSRKQVLAAARKEALRVVNDKRIYPDEDHGTVGQPRVDQERKKVEEIYYAGAALTRESGSVGKPLAAARELAAALQQLGAQDLPPVPDDEALAKRVDEACFEFWTPPRELKALAAARKALAKADPEIASCIEYTNRYRLLMGLSALAVDPKLMDIAQKHSEDMVKRDFFSHDNPDGLSPAARGASGENIAMGPATGVAAVEGWLHSSGHHRNILRGYGSIGVGKCEVKWTQNFG